MIENKGIGNFLVGNIYIYIEGRIPINPPQMRCCTIRIFTCAQKLKKWPA